MKIKVSNFMRLMALVPALVLSIGLFAPVATSPVAAIGLDEGANAAQGEDQEGVCIFYDGEGQPCDEDIFRTVTNILLFLIGAVSVIMLIIGGIRYTLSGGDSSAVTSAKNTILYAIVGLVVAILAYAIVNFVIGSFIG